MASSSIKIKSISEKLGVSNKTLGRLTNRYFGFSPKKLYQIARFNDTLANLVSVEKNPLVNGIGLAYSDQSHFIKECKSFTKLTPSQLIGKMNLAVKDLYLS